MNVDQIIVALRPRTNAEAIDLGFGLARRFYGQLLLIWLMGAVPITIISYALLWEHKFWALAIVWWFKPWYERQQLYYLSLRLFDQPVSFAEIAKGYLTRDWRNVLWSLTLGRLSIARSFNAAVSLLEGLSGRGRRDRLKTLHRRGNSPEILMMMCLILEMMVSFTPLFLMLSFVPPELAQFIDWKSIFWFLFISPWTTIFFHVCTIVAMALISVFFTASGFALYINRRTHLEGWDLELAFRQIAAKVSHTAGAVLLVVLISMGVGATVFVPTSSIAQTSNNVGSSAEQSRGQIDEVLADKVFGYTFTQTTWVPNGPQKEESSRFSAPAPGDQTIGGLLRLVIIVVMLVVLLMALGILVRNRHWLGNEVNAERRRADLPVELFGLAIDAESLPEDIAQSAMRLLEQGDPRAALSLLYRASLSRLIHRGELVISDAATEGECLRQVQGAIAPEAEHYFTDLTRGWQRQAYAHESMPNDQLTQLIHRWSSFLAARSAGRSLQVDAI